MNDLVEFYSIAILNGGMDENFRITKPLVLGTFGGGKGGLDENHRGDWFFNG